MTTRSCAKCRACTARWRIVSRTTAQAGANDVPELATFLRMGSWIGGDRDGNPFVTAEVMRGTLQMQSSRIFSFYFDELHALGSELSMATHLAGASPEVMALAEQSPDPSPHRKGEPYRLAVSGIYARLAATARAIGIETNRPPVGDAAPYATAVELRRDLDALHASLVANNSLVIARGGCGICAAPSIVSAFISPRSTCGRTPPYTSARWPNCSKP